MGALVRLYVTYSYLSLCQIHPGFNMSSLVDETSGHSETWQRITTNRDGCFPRLIATCHTSRLDSYCRLYRSATIKIHVMTIGLHK